MATYFGNFTDNSALAIGANFVYFFGATCNLSGNVTDGRVISDSGSGSMSLAVYTDSTGTPSTLLGVSNAITISGANTYNTTFPTPFPVVNGTAYWLAWLCNSAPSMGSIASGAWWYQAATYPTFPGTTTSPTSGSGRTGALQVGVTPAGATFVPSIMVVM
jgi:hypothetical protein